MKPVTLNVNTKQTPFSCFNLTLSEITAETLLAFHSERMLNAKPIFFLHTDITLLRNLFERKNETIIIQNNG